MTLFLNAAVSFFIVKKGQRFDRNNYPILFNSVTSVRAEMQMSDIAKIEIKLNPSYGDAIQILKDGLLGLGIGTSKTVPAKSDEERAPKNLDSGNAVVATESTSGALLGDVMSGFAVMYVQFVRPNETLSGQPFETSWFAGAVTQPDVSFNGTEFEISIRGYGNAVFLSGPEFITKIKNRTALEVIEDMAAYIGRKIVFAEGDSVTEAVLKEKKITGDRKETALATIKWVLSQVSCEFLTGDGVGNEVGDSTILVRQIASMFTGKPRYTFVQMRQIDPEQNIFPMTSFNLQSAGSLFISGRAFGNYQFGLDSKTKAAIKKVYSSEDVKQKESSTSDSTGVKADLATPGSPGFHGEVYTRSNTQDNASHGESAVAKDLASYQKFSFEIEGMPGLAPMQLCQIRIADVEELSGVILISKVTHIFSSGWMTEIEGAMTGGLASGVKDPLPIENSTPSKSSTFRSPRGLQ